MEQQFSSLDSVMESGDHSKNGASPKSHTNRKNLALKTVIFVAFCVCAGNIFAQEYWNTDSIVGYSLGSPNNKIWNGGQYRLFDPEVKFYDYDATSYMLQIPGLKSIWSAIPGGYYPKSNRTASTKNDSKGYLIEVEYKPTNGTPSTIMQIKYNDKYYPVSAEQFDPYNRSQYRTQFEYNANNQIILLERFDYNERKSKAVVTYDGQGRPATVQIFTNSASNNYLLSTEYIFYYSDGKTSNSVTEPIKPIVYLFDQNLYIKSEKPDRITVYSMNGSKLFETEVRTGVNTIHTKAFPKGILLVKDSSGRVTKVMNR